LQCINSTPAQKYCPKTKTLLSDFHRRQIVAKAFVARYGKTEKDSQRIN
jgi:hypothetical protein